MERKFIPVRLIIIIIIKASEATFIDKLFSKKFPLIESDFGIIVEKPRSFQKLNR